MASKQWTAEDIEKIWNSTGNGAQTNTAPLPTLNNTSKKTTTSSTYKFKPYEDKQYTAEDIEKVWKNVERGKQVQSEMKAKATSAPAKNRTVPKYLTLEERQAQSRKQLAEGTDPASMSLKEKERKENVKRLNNIARQTGTTDVQQYAKRFNLDPSVSEKVREDYKKKEARAEELTSMPARTIAENNELENIRMDVDAHNKALDYAKKEAAKDKNVVAIKSDILDDNTLAQMDARAKQLQSMTNRTQKENDELQSIYDAKEKHDKAIEREKVLNGENHLVNNTKYKQLMSNGRFASDMDVLVDVLYNNADQDATVSEAWAANEGAKNITGGLTRDQYLDQLSKRYELTEAELKDIALSRKVEHDNEELAKFREDVGRFGAQHPLLGSAGSFVGTVGSAFEGPYNIAANAITGDDRYTSRMFNTEKEGLREGVKSTINSDLGDTLYDIGMGVGDMGVGAAMGSAPTILAGNTANRTMLDALDRGVDPRHAALYSGATGITDYVANAIGLDYAKNLAMEGITASGIKGALARTAVAGAGEGAENVVQDVAQAFLDRVINGDDAELNQMYDALIAQGYTEDEAFKEVAKQFAKQEAVSFGQGVGMGVAMNLGTRAVNSLNNLPELERPQSNLNKLSQIDRLFTDEERVPVDTQNVVESAPVSTKDVERIANYNNTGYDPSSYDGQSISIKDISNSGNTQIKHTNTLTRSDVVKTVRNNILNFNKQRGIDSDKTLVNDTIGKVVIPNDGIRHGLSRLKNTAATRAQLEALSNLPSYMQDAVLINEAEGREPNSKAYILVGMYNNGQNNVAVRMVVNATTKELEEVNALYALKAKKEGVRGQTASLNNAASTPSTMSVADFLGVVKDYFPDDVSGKVADYYGIEQGKSDIDGLRYSNYNNTSQNSENVNTEAPTQRTYESDVANWESLENKYENLKQYSEEPITVTKQDLPEDIVGYGVDENYDKAPESTKIGTELARRGYNVMENGGNNNILRNEWSILEDAVAHHLAEENIPASIMAEAYDTIYQQGGTLNDALKLAAEMAGTRLNDSDANVGSGIRLGETPTQAQLNTQRLRESSLKAEEEAFQKGQKANEATPRPQAETPRDALEPAEIYRQDKDGWTYGKNYAGDLFVGYMRDFGKVGSFEYYNDTPEGRNLANSSWEGGNFAKEIKVKQPKVNPPEESTFETQADKELPWTTPGENAPEASNENNSLEMNLQFFAKKKAQLESQLNDPNLSDADRARIRSELAEVNELIANMDEKFYNNNPEQGEQRVSNTVSNADMRMDAERAAEELSKDIGKYFVQTEEMSYSKARDKVVKDYEGSLNRYMNNEGSMYDGSDYDAIRILEQDIKSKRKQAIADGDTELAERYKEQLDKLAITRQLRSTTSGEFNQAAAKWIRTAEGAIDVANDLAGKALDMMENGDETQQSEARFIRETADDIADYANELLTSEDLWAELENADRRLRFEEELHRKIQSIGREKGIEVKDELAQKLAKDIMNGQKDAEALARSIATFREYNFLGFDEEFLDEIENIFDTAEQYDYNSRNRVEREEMAFELLANEIYKKGGDVQDKFDAWRYFAMLANTKTHERNIFGNFVFADVIDSSANGIASIAEGATDSAVKSIQKLAGKEQTGIKRTKSFINPASQADQSLLSGSWKDAVHGAYRDLAGHKYQTDVGNAIEQHKPAFNTTNVAGRAANKALEVNDAALSAEDFFFKRQKYTGQLASYLKANGEDASIFEVEGKIKDLMTKKAKGGLSDVEKAELSQLEKRARVLDKARKYAIDKAQYATFNKHNETAGILAKHSKEWRESKNPVARFIGREIESLAAFKNTPANILRAMWDYSPVSFVRSGGKAIQAIASKDATRHTKIGSAEVNEALELLSKGLVGTGIMALGAKLYKDGILTSSKDDVTGKFDETKGKQSYALNIDGASYAIDSLAPAATALFIGAEAYKIWEEHHGEGEDDKFFSKEGIFNGDAINDIVNGTLAVADPVIDQSMLQGAASTLENIRYAQTPGEALMAAVVTPQIGYFSQALPTLGGQIARTADNTRRSLRTNTEGVAGAIERAGRQALNKIPVLNRMNNPYIDMFGRQQENYDGNILQRLGYQTLSPFYKQNISDEPYMEELERLYNLDPENYADVLGEAFPNKIDGQRLTNEEWAKGQTKAGQSWASLINTAIKSSDYQSLSPDEQYEVQKSLQNLAEKIGTKEVRPNKKINDDMLASFDGSNYQEIVDMAIGEAKGKIRNTKIKEAGLPVNETTKSLFDANDKEGIESYSEAYKIGKEYNQDSITKEQAQLYAVKGERAFRKEMEYTQKAKDVGLSEATDGFKKAIDMGMSPEQYKKEDDYIKSFQIGEDDLGNPKYLEHDDTTSAIYRKDKEQGIKDYVDIKKGGGTKDTYDSFKLYSKKAPSSSYIPQLDATSYIKTVGDIEKYNPEHKTNGEVSMEELMGYMNANNFSQSKAQAYYGAFFDNGYTIYYPSKGKHKGKLWYKNDTKKK